MLSPLWVGLLLHFICTYFCPSYLGFRPSEPQLDNGRRSEVLASRDQTEGGFMSFQQQQLSINTQHESSVSALQTCMWRQNTTLSVTIKHPSSASSVSVGIHQQMPHLNLVCECFRAGQQANAGTGLDPSKPHQIEDRSLD